MIMKENSYNQLSKDKTKILVDLAPDQIEINDKEVDQILRNRGKADHLCRIRSGARELKKDKQRASSEFVDVWINDSSTVKKNELYLQQKTGQNKRHKPLFEEF